jgi:hypothetical protein
MANSQQLPSKLFTSGSRFLKNGRSYTAPDNELRVWYNKPKILAHFTDGTDKVLAGEAWNPNAIASRVYGGRFELGWVIMNANNIFHIRELIVGRTLIIPSLSRLIGSVI